MLRKVGRVLLARWMLIVLTFGVFGACTTGCIFVRGGHWHHHDRW